MIRAKAIRHVPGRMNRLEAKYAACLEGLLKAGEIASYHFEGVSLKIGVGRCSYTPDFMVIRNDGVVEMHETKGFWRDDARVKIKAAAKQYPFAFIAVQWEKSGWKREIIQSDIQEA